MLKIAVIGTAGRGADADKLRPSDYECMKKVAWELIQSMTSEAHLFSGGAAWADHVAVELFVRRYVNYLTLYLPAKFDLKKARFVDTGIKDYIRNPGGTANHYHELFAEKAYANPWLDLRMAHQLGAKIVVGKGFHDRNDDVAKADAVIAFTFGEGPIIKDGGTANTFEKYLKARKGRKNLSYHVDLNDWTIHTPARIK